MIKKEMKTEIILHVFLSVLSFLPIDVRKQKLNERTCCSDCSIQQLYDFNFDWFSTGEKVNEKRFF